MNSLPGHNPAPYLLRHRDFSLCLFIKTWTGCRPLHRVPYLSLEEKIWPSLFYEKMHCQPKKESLLINIFSICGIRKLSIFWMHTSELTAEIMIAISSVPLLDIQPQLINNWMIFVLYVAVIIIYFIGRTPNKTSSTINLTNAESWFITKYYFHPIIHTPVFFSLTHCSLVSYVLVFRLVCVGILCIQNSYLWHFCQKYSFLFPPIYFSFESLFI